MRLSKRIAITTSGMVATAMIVIGAVSFWTSRVQIFESAEQAIEYEASLSSQAVAGRLKVITETFNNLASNTVVFNALIDSAGLETYLLPFFRGFSKIAEVPVTVALLDFQGNTVAQTEPLPVDPKLEAWFKRAIAEGKSSSHISMADGRRMLVLAYMLLYPRTKTVEGVLVFKLPLDELLGSQAENVSVTKVELIHKESGPGGAGELLSRWSEKPTSTENLSMNAVRAIAGGPIVANLGLALRVSQDGRELQAKLTKLLTTYIAISLFCTAAVFVAGYWAGQRLTEPARRLEALAGSVVASEAFDDRFEVTGADEINQVGESFNHMLDHLGEVYFRLNNSASRLTALVRSLPNTVVIVSEDGEAVSIMEETEGSSGRQNGTVASAPLPNSDEPWVMTQRVINEKRPQVLEYSAPQDGEEEERWFEATVTPLPEDFQGPPSAMWVIRDITEQRKADALLHQAQKMEAVGQLTGGVAHDFNNLLAVILGNVDLIQEKLGDEHHELNAVFRAAQRGAELTNRLLAFSRRTPLRPSLINANDLIGDMVGMMTRTLGETIDVRPEKAEGLWNIMADQSQIDSAVLNLAINARDAMPDGGRLTITTGNYQLSDADEAVKHETLMGDYVYIRVSDTGQGIPRDVLPRVFEPFFTTKEVGDGSGLGLSMVYGFMRQSGGFVGIDTEEGRGTDVTLYFPRTKDTGVRTSTGRETTLPRGKGESVFVIEDDPEVLGFIVNLLIDLNYKVETAPDAIAALSVSETIRSCDILLCDVVLPGGINGPQFVEQIRAMNNGIAVIFMSGYPLNVVAKDIAIMQSKFFLPKPFRRKEFAELIREAVES